MKLIVYKSKEMVSQSHKQFNEKSPNVDFYLARDRLQKAGVIGSKNDICLCIVKGNEYSNLTKEQSEYILRPKGTIVNKPDFKRLF